MLQADVLMKKKKKEKRRKEKENPILGPFDPIVDVHVIREQKKDKNTGVKSTAHVYDLKNPAMRTAWTSLCISIPKIFSHGFFFFCS